MTTAAFAAPVSSTPPGAAEGRAGDGLRRLPREGRPGVAAAVRVPDAPLVFTGIITATDVSGDESAQAGRAVDALAAALERAGSDLSQVVRLNAYALDDASSHALEAVLAQRFSAAAPAISLLRSPLAVAGARVGLEAVAVSARSTERVEVVDGGSVAILPRGGKIFISGQAERGPDLASATRLTMAGLHRSLTHLGLKKTDVVQVKAFVRPFADHAAARQEISASFDGTAVPAIVLLEWESELFTEIELVASAGSLPPPAGDVISHAALPWLNKSPRYSHVCHVAGGTPLIFIAAVGGGAASDVRSQMKSIFERLGSTLFEAGSSFRNLAKATYYLADPAAFPLLGDIRAVYFDPTRAPAASAIRVARLPEQGRAAAIDLIAVPLK